MGVPLFIIHFILGCAIISHSFGGSTIYHRLLLVRVPPPHGPPPEKTFIGKDCIMLN